MLRLVLVARQDNITIEHTCCIFLVGVVFIL